MSTKGDILELKNVSKTFSAGNTPLHILLNLSLSILQGETIAITGPSGSGKSTLLNLFAGLDRLSSGAILLEGREIQNWTEEQLADWRRKDVGFIFQDFRLVPRFTALENVSLPLELLGQPTHVSKKQSLKLLSSLGLADRVHHFPQQLSGGEKQRVAIARAFIHKPKIIFADEPTGNLDPLTSKQVLTSLMDINQNHTTTLILVTHNEEIANTMDRTISLKNGDLLDTKK